MDISQNPQESKCFFKKYEKESSQSDMFGDQGCPDAPRGVEKDPAAAAAAVMADAAALAVMPTGAVSRVPGCLVSIGGRSHV